MPVLGVVVTLSEPGAPREAALGFLRRSHAVELGEALRGRLPVVLSTSSRDEDKALWADLEALEGVTHLELTFADFSDLIEAPS